MTQLELNEVLKEHRAWLCYELCGKRADLSSVDLRGVNLNYADLRGANLNYADLRGANLMGADLRDADLRCADLSHTDFSNADLRCADLSHTDFSSAYFSNADLRGANLRGVRGMSSMVLSRYFPIICPEIGEFIGWKKVKYNWIVKLKITENAKRSSAFGRKCRCSEALVLAIENLDGTPAHIKEVQSKFDPSFKYHVGEMVRVPDFDDDRTHECAPGIHFFVTRQEAVDYG